MKRILFTTIGLLALVGCSPNDNSPDAIRRNTATATSAAARDVKAVAQGVTEGLRAKGPININKASEEELQKLPGIDAVHAQKIVDGRPYDNSIDLVKKHLVSRTEYDRIASQIVAK